MRFNFDLDGVYTVTFNSITKAVITYIGSDVTEKVVLVRESGHGVWVLFPLSESRTDVGALSFIPWTAIGAIDVHEVEPEVRD